MTVLPLIARELRAEARRPWNYWMRILASAVVMTVFFSASASSALGGIALGNSGAALFRQAGAVLYGGIWLVVPLLTADCLSREKREGTLGLLFLTTLTAPEIVAAKGLVHLLRAVSFLLAALPVLTIPLLIGGVTMGQVLWVLSADLGAILLALTAGLVASAFTREWVRAVLLTAILAVALLLVHQSMLRSSVVTRTIGTTVITTVAMASTARLLWLPLALFAMAMLIAQRRLRDASLDESLSKRKLWLLQTFCRPVLWKEKFRVLMNRSLDRNPIGWLHQYSWSARLTKWGWCFVVIALETHLADWLAETLITGICSGVEITFR